MQKLPPWTDVWSLLCQIDEKFACFGEYLSDFLISFRGVCGNSVGVCL